MRREHLQRARRLRLHLRQRLFGGHRQPGQPGLEPERSARSRSGRRYEACRASKLVEAARTLRTLAALLAYPDDAMQAQLPRMREVLQGEKAVSAARLAEARPAHHDTAWRESLDNEAEYVSVHSGRATLDRTWSSMCTATHATVARRRSMAQTYEKAGRTAEGELPDDLPVVLEFVSTQPAREAQAFLAEMAPHSSNAILPCKLQKAPRPTRAVVLLELAGEKVQPVKLLPETTLIITGLSRRYSTDAPPRARPGRVSRNWIHFVCTINRIKERRRYWSARFSFEAHPYICFTVFILGS